MEQRTRFLYVSCFIMSAVSGLLIPVIPLFALSLGATPIELGLIGSIGAVVYVIVTISTGKIGYRIGEKKLIVISCLIYAGTCSLYLYVTSALQIVILRTMEGFSFGLFWPQIESLIAEDHSGSAEMVSKFGVSWSLGNVLGGFLSGFALEVFQITTVLFMASLTAASLGLANVFFIRGRNRLHNVFKKTEEVSLQKVVLELKSSWWFITLYSFSSNMMFAYFPAYAEINSISKLAIGLCIFLLMAGRTIAFYFFKSVVKRLEAFTKVGLIMMSIGSISIVLTTKIPGLLTAALSLGVGAGLTYSISFHKAMTVNSSKRTRYSSVFEGFVGMGYTASVIGGVLAKENATAPYLLSFAVTTMSVVTYTAHKFLSENTHKGLG